MEWSLAGIDGPLDCGLRVLVGEFTFDPDWELDLTARTGGLSAIASVPVSNSSTWVMVLEESAMPEPLPVAADNINWGWSVWRRALLEGAGDQSVVPDTEAELARGSPS